MATAPYYALANFGFFLPALLKPKERKWFVPTFVAALCLFIGGTIFLLLHHFGPGVSVVN